MTKILFVCHGNICRSPMAEFVMKRLVSDAGRAAQFEIASAATSAEEIGNPVYPPARRKLAEHGIDCAGHAARQIRRADYDRYDLIIGMDEENLRNLRRLFGGDPDGKVHLLMDYTPAPARLPTRGTPAILKALGRMCWKAAGAFQKTSQNNPNRIARRKLLRVIFVPKSVGFPKPEKELVTLWCFLARAGSLHGAAVKMNNAIAA